MICLDAFSVSLSNCAYACSFCLDLLNDLPPLESDACSLCLDLWNDLPPLESDVCDFYPVSQDSSIFYASASSHDAFFGSTSQKKSVTETCGGAWEEKCVCVPSSGLEWTPWPGCACLFRPGCACH